MRRVTFSAIDVRVLDDCQFMKMALYIPRWRPDGEVVVLSLQFLNKSRRSSVEIWSDIVVPDCVQLVSTCCMLRSLDTVVMLMSPARIWSANFESAAQLSRRRFPMVNGVPAH